MSNGHGRRPIPGMNYYTIPFIYTDEATPRETHTRSVMAASADDARMTLVAEMYLAGDRISTGEAYTSSWNN